jgi:hypothetical protein
MLMASYPRMTRVYGIQVYGTPDPQAAVVKFHMTEDRYERPPS